MKKNLKLAKPLLLGAACEFPTDVGKLWATAFIIKVVCRPPHKGDLTGKVLPLRRDLIDQIVDCYLPQLRDFWTTSTTGELNK